MLLKCGCGPVVQAASLEGQKCLKCQEVREAVIGTPEKEVEALDISPIKVEKAKPDAPKIYIAGPMRGIEFYNYPEFDKAKGYWLDQGWIVISPADLDRESGYYPEAGMDWNKAFDGDKNGLKAAIGRDVKAILDADAIYMLDGWQNSQGAKCEKSLAEWAGKKVFYQSQEDILEEALRITRGDRQASYGPPDQDFKRTAGMWTSFLSDDLKDGHEIKTDHVAAMMILLKCSRQKHQKKRDNWADILREWDGGR